MCVVCNKCNKKENLTRNENEWYWGECVLKNIRLVLWYVNFCAEKSIIDRINKSLMRFCPICHHLPDLTSIKYITISSDFKNISNIFVRAPYFKMRIIWDKLSLIISCFNNQFDKWNSKLLASNQFSNDYIISLD